MQKIEQHLSKGCLFLGSDGKGTFYATFLRWDRSVIKVSSHKGIAYLFSFLVAHIEHCSVEAVEQEALYSNPDASRTLERLLLNNAVMLWKEKDKIEAQIASTVVPGNKNSLVDANGYRRTGLGDTLYGAVFAAWESEPERFQLFVLPPLFKSVHT
jgi:hypothetical protein